MEEQIQVNLDFIIGKSAVKKEFDGVSDDLLSGGAGFNGLKSDVPPEFKNPENPGCDEIRKRTLWNNYRSLVDISDAYYGKIYGPGANTEAPELIAGEEYTALCDGNVTVMLQIPASFNPEEPCLIAAPSSGSRGIYGAVGVIGEWALKKGYAVVYTDKGTGVGYHNLDCDKVGLVDGTLCDAALAKDRSVFTAISSDNAKRKKIINEFKKKYPHRIAGKHAHSKANPQKDWGKYVLWSIEFASCILQEKYGGNGCFLAGRKLTVIAGGISNGGGASLMAAEQDSDNLIDAVVVSEPNITPVYCGDFSIIQGDSKPFKGHSKNLADYMSLLNIYQPCASLAPAAANAPLNFSPGVLSPSQCEMRCLSLKEKGLLKGDTIDAMANEASEILRDYGIIDEQTLLQPSHYKLDISRSIAFTYIAQYGRFDVTDNLCGYSFAAVDEKGKPRALTEIENRAFFSDQTGIPPFGVVKLINNLDRRGSVEDRISASPSTGRKDMNLDGALKLRRLVTGVDEKNKPLSGAELSYHKRVKKGILETLVTTDTGKRPVIIVTGRADAILHINHSSRSYAGAKFLTGKNRAYFRYYEITKAHHVDAFNDAYANKKKVKLPLFFAPLNHYYFQSLDLMIRHLQENTPLPESQVVRPEEPRDYLPEIKENPSVCDLILFENKRLKIPG